MNNNIENKIQCLECKEYFEQITSTHLKKCSGLTTKQYKEKYPDVIFICQNAINKIIVNNKSLFRKGHVSPNKGKKLSNDHKKKIGDSLRGRKLSDDHCKNIGDGNRGKKLSEIHKKFISNIHKGMKYKEESKQKMSNSAKESYKNGREPWNKGLKNCYSKETLKQMGEKNKDRKLSDETKQKIGDGNRGKMVSEETRQKQRIARLKDIEKKNGIAHPNFNLSACKFFDYLNKEYNINGYHALNGGEYHIVELGYFVDYYDPILNLIIEWDESHHYDNNSNLKEKDKIRENEIKKFLNCKFIRINQGKSNWQNMKIEMIENLLDIK